MKKLMVVLLAAFLCVISYSQEVVNVGKTKLVRQTADIDETETDTSKFRISSLTDFDYRITCIGTMVVDTVERTVYIYESPTEDDGYVLTDSITVNGDDYNYTDSYTSTVGLAEWIKLVVNPSPISQTNSLRFYVTVKKNE